MRKKLGLLITVLFTQIGFSQDYLSEFQQYCQKNDTLNQLNILTKWEAENPKDPELFTSYFNYHFMKSKEEILAISTEQPEGDALAIMDSLNQPAGYLGSEIHYNFEELSKGFNKIDEGIKLYPNRLDMRFGKIYALGQVGEWDTFTSEIIKTVQYSSTNNNNWTWTHNEKQEDPKDFFLTSIQDYQIQLFNTGSDALLINMREIANEILKFYPSHVPSLSNLSITYLITGEYDKGIEPLLKAEKLDPKDYIVLANIAHAYNLKGNTKKAIEYYEKALEHGDERTKSFAEQRLIELKN